MIVPRPIVVQLNPDWPRYRLICGEVKRHLDPSAPAEVWDGSAWVAEKLHE